MRLNPLVAEGDRDGFAGIGAAPDGAGAVALEDHSVAEDGGQADVGGRGERRGGRRGSGEA